MTTGVAFDPVFSAVSTVVAEIVEEPLGRHEVFKTELMKPLYALVQNFEFANETQVCLVHVDFI
jgi:hypothetical protein